VCLSSQVWGDQHTCAWRGFFLGGGTSCLYLTRYKLSAKNRGLYTYNVKENDCIFITFFQNSGSRLVPPSSSVWVVKSPELVVLVPQSTPHPHNQRVVLTLDSFQRGNLFFCTSYKISIWQTTDIFKKNLLS